MKSVRLGIISSVNACNPVLPVSNCDAFSVSITPNVAMSTTKRFTIALDNTCNTLPIKAMVSAPCWILSSPSILAVPPSNAIAVKGGISITIASVTSNNALAIPTAKANVKGCTKPSNKLTAKNPPINKAIGKSI